jgi:NitT/TauT family transport system substrate-binding protein
MKRLILLTIGMLLLSASAEAKTYKLAMLQRIAWSPATAAEAKGFWTDEGVDVKVVVCANTLQLFTVFKEKRVDIVFDMIGTGVGYYMNGLPVRIIAETDWSHGGDKIIVKKDTDITAIKGKPIGIYQNSPATLYFLDKYLSGINQKISDIRLAEMEPDSLASHFIAGYFNVIVCYEPEASRAEKNGKGKVVATSANYEGVIPEGMIALEEILAAIPKEDLVKILKGWVKAVKWTQQPDNAKEYSEIMRQHLFKDQKYSDSELTAMLTDVRIHDAKVQTERNKDGGGAILYLQDLKRFLEENKLLKKDFAPKEIFDNRAIVEALKE